MIMIIQINMIIIILLIMILTRGNSPLKKKSWLLSNPYFYDSHFVDCVYDGA